MRPDSPDSGASTPWTRTGPQALDGVAGELDDLLAACAAPVTARRPWLQVWLEHHPDHEPLVVTVAGPDGSLVAAALLATRRRAGVTQVVPLGDGASDVVVMPARSHADAERLARALADDLGRRRPWRLTARHHDASDEVVPRLARRLRHATTEPGDVSPVMRAGAQPTLEAHVSKSHRKGSKWLRNRLAREGVAVDIEHLRRVDHVRRVLPEVEEVHRRRDRELGRSSPMDDPRGLAFFRELVLRHAELDELCLTVLRLDGELAAYALCFVDGASRRMWNCRFDPAYARHSPGRLAIDAAVAEALSDGVDEFDFMRGEEGYKRSYADSETRTVDLRAASGRGLWALDRAVVAARDLVRRLEASSGPAATRTAALVRSAQARNRT